MKNTKTESHIGYNKIGIEINGACVNFPLANLNRYGIKKYISTLINKNRIYERQLRPALSYISLKFAPGDKVAIIGKNGAGKTTLLRTINGVYVPFSGSINVNGKIRSLLELSFGMDQEATGSENLILRAELLGVNRQYIKKNLDKIIEFTELGDAIDRQIKTYSSGMLLKLAFAISTIGNPEILLMDEWMSVGDVSFQRKAESKLLNIVNNASIFIIATHDLDLVSSLCNRVIYMSEGYVVYDGGVEQGIDKYLRDQS